MRNAISPKKKAKAEKSKRQPKSQSAQDIDPLRRSRRILEKFRSRLHPENNNQRRLSFNSSLVDRSRSEPTIENTQENYTSSENFTSEENLDDTVVRFNRATNDISFDKEGNGNAEQKYTGTLRKINLKFPGIKSTGTDTPITFTPHASNSSIFEELTYSPIQGQKENSDILDKAAGAQSLELQKNLSLESTTNAKGPLGDVKLLNETIETLLNLTEDEKKHPYIENLIKRHKEEEAAGKANVSLRETFLRNLNEKRCETHKEPSPPYERLTLSPGKLPSNNNLELQKRIFTKPLQGISILTDFDPNREQDEVNIKITNKIPQEPKHVRFDPKHNKNSFTDSEEENLVNNFPADPDFDEIFKEYPSVKNHRQPRTRKSSQTVNQEVNSPANMGDEKLIRSAIANLPSVTEDRSSFLRFLNACEREYQTLRARLDRNRTLMQIFVNGITARLPEMIFDTMVNETPGTFQEFLRTVLKATNFVRPRTIIEASANT